MRLCEHFAIAGRTERLREINIPDDVLEDVSIKGKKYGIETVKPFSVDDFVLGEWVGLKCRYGCSQFDTNWSCPPATPELSQARAIIGEYSLALLLVGSQKCTYFYINNSRNRSEQVRYWKGTVFLTLSFFYADTCHNTFLVVMLNFFHFRYQVGSF
jgi:hypothetical protein